MYNAVKRSIRHIMALWLQDTIAAHPELAPFKTAFSNPRTEELTHACIVSGIAENSKFLDTQDHITQLDSWITLYGVRDKPSAMVEWALEAPGFKERAYPGMYILDALDGRRLQVTSILEHREEIEADNLQLTRIPILEDRARFRDGYGALFEGTHYTLDYTTGIITLLDYERDWFPWTVRYLTVDPDQRTVDIEPYTLRGDIINGVNIAFGPKIEPNDRQIIAIDYYPQPAYQVKGGEAEISFTIEVLAGARHTAEDASDVVQHQLLKARSYALTELAIHIKSVSAAEASVEETTAGLQHWTVPLTCSASVFWTVYYPEAVELHDIYIQISEKTELTDLEAAQREESAFLRQFLPKPDELTPARFVINGHFSDGRIAGQPFHTVAGG